MTIDQQFNGLNEKLQLLIRQQQRLHRENERLRGELQLARTAEEEARRQVDQLEQQAAILKMGSADLSPEDRREFEKKINQYLREIDRCISFLSQ